MRKRSWLIVIAAWLLPAVSQAADGGAGFATTAGTIAAHLQNAGSNWGGVEWLDFCGYNACGDQGGGTFHRETCTPDNVILCFADSHGNTFRRKEVRGLAAEAGLTYGSVYDAAANPSAPQGAANRLSTAIAALQGIGIATLRTGGVNLYLAQDFTLPAGFTLDCEAQQGGQNDGDDFRYVSEHGIIAHPSTTHFYFNGSDAAALKGCLIERSDGAHAPTVFVPSTPVRDGWLIRGEFAGAGITINNTDAPKLENVMILGFDKAVDVADVGGNVKRPEFSHINFDANSFSVHDIGSDGELTDIRGISFLTSNPHSGTFKNTVSGQLDNLLDDGAGHYKAVTELLANDPGAGVSYLALQSGDPVEIETKNKGTSIAQSANGGWTAGSVSLVSSGTDGCAVTTCQEVVLTGSKSGATTSAATWLSGSNVLTGIAAADVAHAAVGQTIASASCVPASTEIADVHSWPDGTASIWLRSSADHTTRVYTTCAATAQNVTFQDVAFGGDHSSDDVLIADSTYRFGNCMDLVNVAGLRIRGHCYEHTTGMHIGGNVGNLLIQGFSLGLGDGTPDKGFTSVLLDDTGGDSGGRRCHIDGAVLSQHYPNVITVNSADSLKKPCVFTNVGVGSGVGDLYGGSINVEAGALILMGSNGGHDNIYLCGASACGLTLEGYHGNDENGGTSLYVQDSTADLSGCGDTGISYFMVGAYTVGTGGTPCLDLPKGPFDLSRYGTADPTSSACLASRASCDAAAAVALAFAASKAYGDGGVTAPKGFVQYSTDLSIPAGQYLDCRGSAPDRSNQSDRPAYTLNSTIVLNPAHTVVRGAHTDYRNCREIPSWYTSLPTTHRQVIDFRHSFIGTGTVASADTANMENVQIGGFDVCDSETNNQNTVDSNLLLDCAVAIDVGKNPGHLGYSSVSAWQWLANFGTDGGGNRLDIRLFPITALASNGGLLQITSTGAGSLLQAGDTVTLEGIGTNFSRRSRSDCTSGSPIVTDLDPDVIGIVTPGAVISTTHCGLNGAKVTFVDGVNNAVTTDTNATGTENNVRLTFNFSSYGPSAQNRVFTVSSVVDANNLVLAGSSYAGPVDETVAYNPGVNAVAVRDTANIGAGQYACTSGTASSAPFCTPPSDWALPTITTTDAALNSSSYTGNFTISGTLTNVPCEALNSQMLKFKLGTEIMQYACNSGSNGDTTLKLVARAVDGTTAAAHDCSGTCTLTLNAPMVVGVFPDAMNGLRNRVALNIPNQATTAQTGVTVAFANQATAGGSPLGTLASVPNFVRRTLDTNAGAPVDGIVSIIATGSGSTITATGNSATSGAVAKIHTGMVWTDTSGGATGTVTAEPSGAAITVSGSPSFTGHTIVFTGCGYPTAQAWLGSCAATAFLFGSPAGIAAGIAAFDLHSFGYETGIKISSPSTNIASPGIGGGGGNASSADPSSAAIWTADSADTVNITNGRMAGHQFAYVNSPSVDSSTSRIDQRTGVNVSNVELRAAIPFVNYGRLDLSNANSGNGGAAYGDSGNGATALLSNNSLPLAMTFRDDRAALSALQCAPNNNFADGACGVPTTAPVCGSNCTSISGPDSNASVVMSASPAVVYLGGIYRTAPPCTVSNSASATLARISAQTGPPSPSVTITAATAGTVVLQCKTGP